MMTSVPQFIGVEDKIAGPLTWRQLLWLVCMGAFLLVFFNLFDTSLFIIVAVPTILLFVTFAFYRPGGFSMTTYTLHMILFLFRPKVFLWERPIQQPMRPKTSSNSHSEAVQNHEQSLNQATISELARILDNRDKKSVPK
ncbi:MAG: PrgI family protein [Minisyncoccota bacterium]